MEPASWNWWPNRLSTYDMIQIIGVLLGIVAFLYVVNKVYVATQGYEGLVLEKDAYGFIVIERDDETKKHASVGSRCASVSLGDYVVKRRGSKCPKVVRREKDVKVPDLRRNPDLSRQLDLPP